MYSAKEKQNSIIEFQISLNIKRMQDLNYDDYVSYIGIFSGSLLNGTLHAYEQLCTPKSSWCPDIYEWIGSFVNLRECL